jgi:hypothetical protein
MNAWWCLCVCAVALAAVGCGDRVAEEAREEPLDTASAQDVQDAPDLARCEDGPRWRLTTLGDVWASSGSRRVLGAAPLADGGLLLWGEGFSGEGFNDAWLARLDREGQVVWDRLHGAARYFDSVQVASVEGGEVVALGGHGYNAYTNDLRWLRLSLDTGDLVAEPRLLEGPSNDLLMGGWSGVSGMEAALFSVGSGGAADHIWLVGLDAQGGKRWEVTSEEVRLGKVSAQRVPDGVLVVGNRAQWTPQNTLDGPLQPYVWRVNGAGEEVGRYTPQGAEAVDGWGWHLGMLPLAGGGALLVADQTPVNADPQEPGRWTTLTLDQGLQPTQAHVVDGRLLEAQVLPFPGDVTDDRVALLVANSYFPAPSLEVWVLSAQAAPRLIFEDGFLGGQQAWLAKGALVDGKLALLSSHPTGAEGEEVAPLSWVLIDVEREKWVEVVRLPDTPLGCSSPLPPLVLSDGRVALVAGCQAPGASSPATAVWIEAAPCP